MSDTELLGVTDTDASGPGDSQPAPLGGDGIEFATPGPDDIQPVVYETLNRVLTGADHGRADARARASSAGSCGTGCCTAPT